MKTLDLQIECTDRLCRYGICPVRLNDGTFTDIWIGP